MIMMTIMMMVMIINILLLNSTISWWALSQSPTDSSLRVYTRSPSQDSCLFGASPWKVLATTYEQIIITIIIITLVIIVVIIIIIVIVIIIIIIIGFLSHYPMRPGVAASGNAALGPRVCDPRALLLKFNCGE